LVHNVLGIDDILAIVAFWDRVVVVPISVLTMLVCRSAFRNMVYVLKLQAVLGDACAGKDVCPELVFFAVSEFPVDGAAVASYWFWAGALGEIGRAGTADVLVCSTLV
jgi:hypothetical protein